MIDWSAYTLAFLPVACAMLAAWAWSLARSDVSIVDVLWSLMFVTLAGSYFVLIDTTSNRALLVLVMALTWALRLSLHIALRNHGQGEDRRYRAIRHRNQPGFAWKSLYLVFGLQALLAWFIAMPLLAAMHPGLPLGWLDVAGVTLWLTGMVFEVVGDAQLARFRSTPGTDGKVLDQGLWRWTRHPNYFGECLLWWGFYLLALAAGAWWTVLSPLLMTFLLLRVSGVRLLEQDIAERRPEYLAYMRSTSAFFPRPPRVRGLASGVQS